MQFQASVIYKITLIKYEICVAPVGEVLSAGGSEAAAHERNGFRPPWEGRAERDCGNGSGAWHLRRWGLKIIGIYLSHIHPTPFHPVYLVRIYCLLLCRIRSLLSRRRDYEAGTKTGHSVSIPHWRHFSMLSVRTAAKMGYSVYGPISIPYLICRPRLGFQVQCRGNEVTGRTVEQYLRILPHY